MHLVQCISSKLDCNLIQLAIISSSKLDCNLIFGQVDAITLALGDTGRPYLDHPQSLQLNRTSEMRAVAED